MALIRTIATLILLLTLVVFIVLFGSVPKFRHTPIGWTHRLIMKTVPHYLILLDVRLTGGRLLSSVTRFFNYLLFDKHPLIKGFYLTLVTGGIWLFYIGAWDHLWSTVHKMCVPIVCTLPYITMHLASTSDPGIVTVGNHEKAMKLYPFDEVNFYPGVDCYTCHFEKPARSKHCPVCKHCIARQDHHCIWINNCVGHANTHYFIAFLQATNILLTYGFYLTLIIMREVIRVNLKPGIELRNLGWNQYFNLWIYAMMEETWCGIVCLLCFMTGLMSWGFSSYHLYLIWAGTTTNESNKFADWKDDVAYREVYLAHRPASETTRTFKDGIKLSADNWPIQTDKVVKRVVNEDEYRQLDERLEWVEVKSMKEVDNIYDIGFWRNLKTVVRPARF